MKQTKLLLMAACVVLWMLLACGDGGGGVVVDTRVPVPTVAPSSQNVYGCKGQECNNLPGVDVTPVIIDEVQP
jgi:hypothetical protein